MKFKNFIIAFALIIAMGISCLGVSSAFAEQNALEIGVGKSATVTVSNVTSQDVTVADGVTEGQYFIYAKVTSPEGEDPYRIYPNVWLNKTEESEGQQYYLDYNEQLGLYYATIETGAGKTIAVNADYYNENYEIVEQDVTMEIYLGNLAIGDFNYNSIYGVKTPASISLDNVSAGKYILAVTPEVFYEGSISFDAEIDGEPVALEYETIMSGSYTATVEIADTSKTLTINADTSEATFNEGEVLTISVSLYTYKEAEPFPTGDVTFKSGESKIYSYKPVKDGYYTLNVNSTNEDAYFSVVLKKDPNSLEGEFIQTGYPVKLEAVNTYYLDINCYIEWDGTGEEPTATATLSFEEYTVPTLVPNEVAYVPTSETYQLNLADGITGTYNLYVLEVPYDVTTVTVHYGENTVVLTPKEGSEEGFSAEVDLTGVKTIYLEASPEFVAGVLLEERVTDYNLPLNEAKEISLAAGEALTYYLTNLPLDIYSITLSYAEGTTVMGVSVIDYNKGETFVISGKSFGILDAFNYDTGLGDEVVPALGLTFTSETAATFTVTVSAYTPTELSIDDTNGITLEANSVLGCVVYNLPVGNYTLFIEGGNGKTVVWTVLDGDIISEGEMEGEFTVQVEEKEVFIFFENMDANSETFFVTII